ncbi:MAG: hypothetical protein ACE14V_02350 [bacterium]
MNKPVPLKLTKQKFIAPKTSNTIMQQLLTELNTEEIAIVKNPAYIYSPIEFYPLAPKYTQPLPKITGIVQDMDGTTTTTELLCVHSLEWMIRRISGRTDISDWQGLDRTKDYPHIIGNSTTKHVEYLIRTYEKEIKFDAFRTAFFEAIIWTLSMGQDASRRKEVIANIQALGIGILFEDRDFKTAIVSGTYIEKSAQKLAQKLIDKYGSNLNLYRFSDKVRAALDIYYYRYHTILMDIAAGQGRTRAQELLPASSTHRLIEPMPAISVFLALVKGWLGEDVGIFYNQIADYIISKSRQWDQAELLRYKPRLAKLGRYFNQHPAKIAVVTSSIAYEANIVLSEVFNVIREQIGEWQISDKKKKILIDRFRDYRLVFDGYITASDSSEIRLKPHRDLYSIALHQLGIPKSEYRQVIGFEDSESGTIAIRAAGIGISVAVPFADTADHDLSAATYILHAQLPEAILAYNCFLDPKVLKQY